MISTEVLKFLPEPYGTTLYGMRFMLNFCLDSKWLYHYK